MGSNCESCGNPYGGSPCIYCGVRRTLPVASHPAPAPLPEEVGEDAARITAPEQLVEFLCRLRKRHALTPDLLRAFGLCERFLGDLTRRLAEVEEYAKGMKDVYAQLGEICQQHANKRKDAEARLAELDAHYLAACRQRAESEARVRELEAKKDAAFWQGWSLLAGFIAGFHDEPSLVEEAAREHGVTLGLLEASGCDEFELEPLRKRVFMSPALAATAKPNNGQ